MERFEYGRNSVIKRRMELRNICIRLAIHKISYENLTIKLRYIELSYEKVYLKSCDHYYDNALSFKNDRKIFVRIDTLGANVIKLFTSAT
jgi:hypothetical protein